MLQMKGEFMKKILLNRKEAATYLGISQRTLARRTSEGRIRSISYCKGGRIHYRLSDLDRFIKDSMH